MARCCVALTTRQLCERAKTHQLFIESALSLALPDTGGASDTGFGSAGSVNRVEGFTRGFVMNVALAIGLPLLALLVTRGGRVAVAPTNPMDACRADCR